MKILRPLINRARRVTLPVSALILSLSSSLAFAAADTVIRYGKIYTMDPQKPWADAIAIEKGKITYVGGLNGVKKHIGNKTKVINLYDTDFVIPGLHDVHLHPLEAGSENIGCAVNTNKGVDHWLKTIKGCAKQGNGWLLGAGFYIGTLLEDGRNPVAALDKISKTRPIAIMETTSHAVWVNSKALEKIGFTPNTPNPPGGHIGKLANGKLSGLLLDTAGDMAFHAALNNPSTAQKQRDYEGLLYSLKQIRKYGITSIANARVYWKRGYLDAWYRAREEGKLTARSTLGLWLYPEDINDAAQVDALAGMYDDSDDMLKVTEVKTYDDGITINTTAAMKKPYLKDLGVGLESDKGLNYLTESRLTYYVSELEKIGFNMHIHAIGDRGVHESLNAIETAMDINGNIGRDRRHRLTHLEYISKSDVPRFDELNVVADMQVAGDWTLPGHVSKEEQELLGNRIKRQIPMRELYDANATVTLSSDWDVSTLSPYIGMMHSLQRGNQSLPNRKAALEAYTINGAYALRQDHLVGSLKVGKRADITIVDRNLMTVPVKDVGKAKTVMTIVDGKTVYSL
ncbi:amidohydrolase [Maricurvus nonylphenolicus]|uniref:amidohydrolase n=1 Tax=Maricurvus nonylphenolicus TaxID=1008307 RepID=UPI0036F2328B